MYSMHADRQFAHPVWHVQNLDTGQHVGGTFHDPAAAAALVRTLNARTSENV